MEETDLPLQFRDCEKKKGRTQRNKNRPRHNTGKNTLALVVIETSFHFTVFYFIAFVHLSTTFRPKMENLSLYMVC